jgi:nucleoside 2-deoxyribosyltransferase
MRVYVAAPFEKKQGAKDFARLVSAEGATLVSMWLHSPYNTEGLSAEILMTEAHKDIQDIENCDIFVLLNPPEWAPLGGGGKHVEFGYAFACGKRVAVVGVRSNVFHWHPVVNHFSSVSEFLSWVKHERKGV